MNWLSIVSIFSFSCRSFQFLGKTSKIFLALKSHSPKNFLVISILSLASDSYTFDSDPIFE